MLKKRIGLLNLVFLLDPRASSVQYHGIASLHSFDANVQKIEGEATSEKGDLASARGKLQMDVRSIDTHIAKRNEEMFKLLEPEKYPKMYFTLKAALPVKNVTDDGRVIEDLPPGETKCVLKGELTVKGKTAPIEGRGKCRESGSLGWEVTGEAPVDMKAFGIEPPSVVFITMNPVVSVKYKLVFKAK